MHMNMHHECFLHWVLCNTGSQDRSTNRNAISAWDPWASWPLGKVAIFASNPATSTATSSLFHFWESSKIATIGFFRNQLTQIRTLLCLSSQWACHRYSKIVGSSEHFVTDPFVPVFYALVLLFLWRQRSIVTFLHSDKDLNPIFCKALLPTFKK